MERWVKRLLDVGSILLLASAILDIWLWFSVSYHVPSLSIALFSLGALGLLQALKRLVR